MEQSSYFFSDCIDLDGGGSPYPGTLQDEVIVATTDSLPVSYTSGTSTLPKHPYTSTNGPLVPSPRSTSAQSPVMSFQDVPYTDLLCDPVLLAGSGNATNQTKATEPLTPSSYGTRSSVGTRSSTNSIPSVREPRAMAAARNSSPPHKRKIRHAKPAKSIKEEEDDDPSTDKRQKFLEKNRIAASKCREKKKKWVHDLEHNKSELERQNFELRVEHRNLINELSQTKNMLMTHSACKDPNIDRWLDNEARRIVQTTGASVFSANPLAYVPPNARHRNDSFVSVASMAEFDSPSRRASLTFSQAPSSINDSPIDPFLPMPSMSPKVKEEPAINLDHMPEEMLRS